MHVKPAEVVRIGEELSDKRKLDEIKARVAEAFDAEKKLRR